MDKTARWMLGAALAAWASLGFGQTDFVTFESGQVRPLRAVAGRPDAVRANTPDGQLEIFNVGAGGISHAASVPVGLEPVAIAARSDSEVWVVNHLSDSISIVDVPEPARRAHAAGRRRAARHRLRRTRTQSRVHHDRAPRAATHQSVARGRAGRR